MLGLTGIESESGTTSILCEYFPIGASNVLQAFGYFFNVFCLQSLSLFLRKTENMDCCLPQTLFYLEYHELYAIPAMNSPKIVVCFVLSLVSHIFFFFFQF